MCRTHFVCKDDRKSASTEALFLKDTWNERACRHSGSLSDMSTGNATVPKDRATAHSGGVRTQNMKYEIIKPLNGECPEMTDDQQGWMYLCEDVASHWYGLIKMDDFARLVQIKHPELEPRTIRDAYMNVYYTQEEKSEEAENNEDVWVWITLLTPLVDENGVEYLAENLLAERPETLEQVAAIHERCEMYLPEEKEIFDYYQYGFSTSNEKIMNCIETLSELLDMREAQKAEHLKDWMEEVEKGVENIDEQSGPIPEKEKGRARRHLLAEHILEHETQLVEKNHAIAEVMDYLLEMIPFKAGTREKVVEQLITIFNHTHLPVNNGHTPYQMADLNHKKLPVF